MKKITLVSILSVIAFASPDFKSDYAQSFQQYKTQQQQGFKNYKAALDAEFKNYKKELSKYWEKPELSTKKEWVSYSSDKKSRSKVNFEKENYTVEVIAKNLSEAKKKLSKQIEYVVSKNTKEVVESDTLQKKVQEISKKSLDVISASMKAVPILSTLIFHKKPQESELKKYVNKTLYANKIERKESKLGTGSVYKLTVKLPKNSSVKLSYNYIDNVTKNAKRFKLPYELVFAIMQTESNFNPFAKSHVPAYGLMQIVPRTAGRDVYKKLYKKKGQPSASYLYTSDKNIEMGSAYLNILYYSYLRKITNPRSRLYCTIAAYNTGAGNIAWAFTHTYNISKAAPKINALSSSEVYNKLLSNLKYDEPKNYLRRVNKRMKVYKKVYKEL